MEHSFVLPVTYKDEELTFEAALILSGYTQSYRVVVNDGPLVFERDDSGDFRVVNYGAAADVDAGLLEAIVGCLVVISE